MAFEFFDKAKEVMKKLENTQQENIHKAALLISESKWLNSSGIWKWAFLCGSYRSMWACRWSDTV